MKIKILNFIGFFIALAFLASCDQEAFEEYSSVPAAGAPGLTLTIDSNTDSAITVSYNMNMAGRVTLAVLPASVDTPTVADMKSRPDEHYYYYKHDGGDAQATVTYEGLEPYTEYRVYGVGQNTDGVFSELVITEEVRTEDFVDPELVDWSPAGQSPKVDSDQPIVLTFSENVQYDNTKQVVFSAYFSGINEVVPEDSISISGNVVTINWGILPYNDYCFLSYDEGAFTDYTGNPAAEVISGVIGGYLEGIWFRVEIDPATNIEKIFDNFLGDYMATEYAMDSTTVDWGPYAVEITEDTDESVEYGIIVSNFFDVGADVKLQLYADGTVHCPNQYLYYNSTYDVDVWVSNYTASGSIVEHIYGHWDYTDFGIEMSFTTYVPNMGYYADLYITFEKVTGKTTVKSKGKPASFDPFN